MGLWSSSQSTKVGPRGSSPGPEQRPALQQCPGLPAGRTAQHGRCCGSLVPTGCSKASGGEGWGASGGQHKAEAPACPCCLLAACVVWYVFDPQLHPSTARKDPPGLKCHQIEAGHGSQAGGRPWQCCVRGLGGRRCAPSTSFPPEAGRQAQCSEAEGMHRGFALPGSKESPEQLEVQGMKSQSRDQRAALGKEPQPQKKPAARFNNPGCV